MTFPQTGPWRAVHENHWYFAEHPAAGKRQGPFANRKEADEFVDSANRALADDEANW